MLKEFITFLVVNIAVILFAISSPFANDLSLIFLIAFSLIGPAYALRAALIGVVLKYLNPSLISYSSMSGLLFWILLICIVVRCLPLLRREHLKLLYPIWVFSIVAAILSIVTSKALLVSMMKVAMFALITPSVLLAGICSSGDELKRTNIWLFSCIAAVAILSLFSLLSPSVAYQLRPGSFQGILNHPQSYGTFMSPACAWLITGIIAMPGRQRLIHIFVALLLTLLMLMCLSRTAALATFLGVFFSLVKPLKNVDYKKILIQVASLVATITLVIIYSPQVFDAARGFILKRNDQDVSKSFYDSRGGGIVSQWNNFLDNPLTGTGFGVYSDGSFPNGLVEWHGIPISAPVEKGFVPTALLEETGVVGATIFLLIIFSFRKIIKFNDDPRWISAFWAALTVNFGEAVILSPGGIGLYIWIIIALSVSNGMKSWIEPALNRVTKASEITPNNLMR